MKMERKGGKRPVACQQAGQYTCLTMACTPSHDTLSCPIKLHF